MILAKVVGTVVTTISHPDYKNRRLLVVQPLALPDVKFVPVDLALVGIVDELEVRPDGEFDLVMRKGWNPFT